MIGPSDNLTDNKWQLRKATLGREFIRTMYTERLLKTWLRDRPQGWELVSGYWSPFYIQMRSLPSRPALFKLASEALAELIKNEAPDVNRLIGLASAGVPIAAATALIMMIPMGYTRKLPDIRNADELTLKKKEYGDHSFVEGDLFEHDNLALVDDVAVRFTSKELGIRQISLEVEKRNLSQVKLSTVAVLVDREQGAWDAAHASGISLISLVRFRTEAIEWLRGIALERELDVIANYIDHQEEYQNIDLQEKLRQEALMYTDDM